jgi:hypothetical protein
MKRGIVCWALRVLPRSVSQQEVNTLSLMNDVSLAWTPQTFRREQTYTIHVHLTDLQIIGNEYNIFFKLWPLIPCIFRSQDRFRTWSSSGVGRSPSRAAYEESKGWANILLPQILTILSLQCKLAENYVGLEVLTAVVRKSSVSWGSPLSQQRFRRNMSPQSSGSKNKPCTKPA